MASVQRIVPFLWFAGDVEEAVAFYVSVFDDARITARTYHSAESAKEAGLSEGSVLTISFELLGQPFTALNGNPGFAFTPAVSFEINCRDQAEIDRYWDALSEGGDPKAQQCGWLSDRYGVSWQVVPAELPELLKDKERAARVLRALLPMKKLDLAALRAA